MAELRKSAIPLLVCEVTFFVAAVSLVVLRLISIRILRRKFKAHDFLCFISLAALTGYLITVAIGAVYGDVGEHLDDVPASRQIILLKTFFSWQFLWEASVATFRLSTLLLYIEIFPIKKFRWCAYACVLLVAVFWIGSVLLTLLLCQPLNYNWNKTIPGSCGSVVKAGSAAMMYNTVLDVVAVLLPLPIVWKLQMPKSKKISLTITFALGLNIAGVNLANFVHVSNCNAQDISYCLRDNVIFNTAEMAVGIMVACVPTLGHVFLRRPPKRSSHEYDGPTYKTSTKITSSMIQSTQSQNTESSTDSAGATSLGSLHDEVVDMDASLQYGDHESRVNFQSKGKDSSERGSRILDGSGIRRKVEISIDCEAAENKADREPTKIDPE